MKRDELLLRYAEVSVDIYRKLLDRALTSPKVDFLAGKAVFELGEDRTLPLNGLYIMLDKLSTPIRIVRIGTHEPTSPNGLLPRVFNHLVSSKNRSILRKHIGSSLLAATGGKKLAKWLLKSEKGDAATESAVTEYIEAHIMVAFLPVNDLKVLDELEKYLISAVAQATVTDEQLIAARADWLGNACDDATVAEYGVWNDDHVKWHPRDEAELKKLVRTVDKYLQ